MLRVGRGGGAHRWVQCTLQAPRRRVLPMATRRHSHTTRLRPVGTLALRPLASTGTAVAIACMRMSVAQCTGDGPESFGLPPPRLVQAVPPDSGGGLIQHTLLEAVQLVVATALRVLAEYAWGPGLSVARAAVLEAITHELALAGPVFQFVCLWVVIEVTRLAYAYCLKRVAGRLRSDLLLRLLAAELRDDYDMGEGKKSKYASLEKDARQVVDTYISTWSSLASVLPWCRSLSTLWVAMSKVPWPVAVRGVGVLAAAQAFQWVLSKAFQELWKHLPRYPSLGGPGVRRHMLTVRTCSNEMVELKRAQEHQAAMHQWNGGVGLVGDAQTILNKLVTGMTLISLSRTRDYVKDGLLTSQEYTDALATIQTLRYSVTKMYRTGSNFWTVSAKYDNVMKALAHKPSVCPGEGLRPDRVQGAISLRNVVYRYSSIPDVPVLNGVTLDIAPGQIIALVGQSGAGKTTAARLLLRLFDPDSGQLLLDGHDYRDLDPIWIRQHIGYVDQKGTLFHGSIEDNIKYGYPEASEEHVVAAAKLANAHDFIMKFPEGYQTKVNALSGGQSQRVTIARTIIKNPAILVLDEATSGLDGITEAAVQDALHRVMAGRTTIIISHRVTTVKHADAVVVFDGGKIVEVGTHAELVASGGLYTRLMREAN